MIFSIKSLNEQEKAICLKTISPKAIYALVGNAIANKESLSIIRMGDGEKRLLEADPDQPFTNFNVSEDWNERLGISNMPVGRLQQEILEAGNSCTYFAPSVSGISIAKYHLFDLFEHRPCYFDNFYVNNWTGAMIQMLIEASDGVFILHREYEQIISNFKNNYQFKKEIHFAGFTKHSWQDNEAAIQAAANSACQLVLFSGGPGGKIIGPKIAAFKNKIVLDVGNTLMPWSESF